MMTTARIAVAALGALLAGMSLVPASCDRSPPSAAGPAGGAGGAAGSHPVTTSSSSSATSGGSGGTGNADDPGWWLYDDEIFAPVGFANNCELAVAKLPSPKLPRRTWEPCGPGCQWAVPAQPGQFPPDRYGLDAATLAGEIYFRVPTRGFRPDARPAPGENPTDSQVELGRGVSEVVRLSDNEPVAVVRHSSACLMNGAHDSPFAHFFVRAKGTPSTYWVASNTIQGSFIWSLPGIDDWIPGNHRFDYGDSWGWAAGQGSLQVALTPGSSTLTTVFPGGYNTDPVSHGPLVAWVSWEVTPTSWAKLRGWTEAGGTAVFHDPGSAYHVVKVALSDSKIVWLGATGWQASQGNNESTWVYWSPWTTTPAGMQVNAGPELPAATLATFDPSTYGDWLAVMVGNQSTQNTQIDVVNLATNQVWVVPSRPGTSFQQVMALDATSMLVQEGSLDGIDRMLRIDYAQLDSLAANGWPM